MTPKRAHQLLTEAEELVPAVEGALGYLKQIADKCLANELPAVLTRPPGDCSTCAPKAQLLVRTEDVPRLSELLGQDWLAMVENEGTATCMTVAEDSEQDELPCPACGTAAPLTETGACSDCGLVLA